MSLDNSLQCYVGFDLLGLAAASPARLVFMRDAEVRHAHLTMLAVATASRTTVSFGAEGSSCGDFLNVKPQYRNHAIWMGETLDGRRKEKGAQG